jgi:hypothetical protein
MRQIVAFFGIGLLLLAALNWLARLPGGDWREREMRERLAAMPGRPAVSIGSSIANGFNMAQLCPSGLEYHLTQDAFEMQAAVDFALARPRPARLWIALVAPSIQSWDNGSPGAGWPGHRMTSYRALYSQGYRGLIGGDWRRALTANLMPAIGDEAWRPHMRWLFDLVRGRRAEAPGGVPPGLADRAGWVAQMQERLDPRIAAAFANERAATRAANLRRIAYYTPDVERHASAALIDMNAAIRRSGGRLVVVVPPMTREAREATARHMPEQIGGLRSLLERLTRAGALVRDHWADPRFEGRYDLFRDNEHLNFAGGAAFSRILAADLVEPLDLEMRCRQRN